MKILILMPLDEKWVNYAAGLEKRLSAEVRTRTFGMPNFMQYLIDTGAAKNWTWAAFDSLISAKAVIRTADERDDDLIVIGNASKDWSESGFDAVFSFMDENETLPYKDEFIDKMLEVCKDDETLMKVIGNLYTNEDCKLNLKNLDASAQFIEKYLDTKDLDYKIKSITEKYFKKTNE